MTEASYSLYLLFHGRHHRRIAKLIYELAIPVSDSVWVAEVSPERAAIVTFRKWPC